MASKELLITGAHGALGREILKQFPDALAPARKELDITDRAAVEKFLRQFKPKEVIHTAAFVDVARCEKEKELAWKTNVRGTENIVEALQTIDPETYFIYISTACVFRGDQGNYGEEDIPHPVNFYGFTKLLGEFAAKRMKNILIIRTNFIPRQPWKHEKAFTDRYGTYLFADDVSRGIKEVVKKKMTGIVHICGDRKMSMLELAQLVSPNIKPFTLEEFSKLSQLHLTQNMTLRSTRIPHYKIS